MQPRRRALQPAKRSRRSSAQRPSVKKRDRLTTSEAMQPRNRAKSRSCPDCQRPRLGSAGSAALLERVSSGFARRQTTAVRDPALRTSGAVENLRLPLRHLAVERWRVPHRQETARRPSGLREQCGSDPSHSRPRHPGRPGGSGREPQWPGSMRGQPVGRTRQSPPLPVKRVASGIGLRTTAALRKRRAPCAQAGLVGNDALGNSPSGPGRLPSCNGQVDRLFLGAWIAQAARIWPEPVFSGSRSGMTG